MAAYLYVLVAIVGEDPIEQNEQEGVVPCRREGLCHQEVTKPGRQEDGVIFRHEQPNADCSFGTSSRGELHRPDQQLRYQ